MAGVLRGVRAGVGGGRVPPDSPTTELAPSTSTGFAVSLVLRTGQTELVRCSGRAGARFEDLQFTLGEGPGPDAVRTGLAVQVPDLELVRTERWPALLAGLDGLVVRAVFSFPLSVGAVRVGVMTAVRGAAGPLTGEGTDDARALAHALTVRFLGGGGANGAGGGPLQVLQRAVIHQATGMVSVQIGRSLSEALMRLRAFAYGNDRPIGEVAKDVVARRPRFEDDGTGPRSPEGDRG